MTTADELTDTRLSILGAVRTIVVGPRPAELEALIERRRAIGADLYDEVWDGECHMAPGASGAHGWLDAQLAVVLHPLARRAGLFHTGPFNLGDPNDYRVPDRPPPRGTPGDVEPDRRAGRGDPLPGRRVVGQAAVYATHGVDEVVIVEAEAREVSWLAREGDSYGEVDHSAVVGVPVAEVVAQITWPPPATD